MIIDEDAYLEHFGVRGMRWGVRRKSSLNLEQQEKVNRNRKKAKESFAKEMKSPKTIAKVAAGAAFLGLMFAARDTGNLDGYSHLMGGGQGHIRFNAIDVKFRETGSRFVSEVIGELGP